MAKPPKSAQILQFLRLFSYKKVSKNLHFINLYFCSFNISAFGRGFCFPAKCWCPTASPTAHPSALTATGAILLNIYSLSCRACTAVLGCHRVFFHGLLSINISKRKKFSKGRGYNPSGRLVWIKNGKEEIQNRPSVSILNQNIHTVRARWQTAVSIIFSFFVFLVIYSEMYSFNFHKCGYKTRAVIYN